MYEYNISEFNLGITASKKCRKHETKSWVKGQLSVRLLTDVWVSWCESMILERHKVFVSFSC